MVGFKDFSVKLIFQEHWEDYKKVNPVREIESKEVEKMLSCKGKERGCFECYCKKCDRFEEIPFGCNSRICSCCSKRYTDRWAEMLSEKIIPKIPHRHLTFSMPEILWNFIKENRELQKIVMDASYQTKAYADRYYEHLRDKSPYQERHNRAGLFLLRQAILFRHKNHALSN